jgi:hypothetical protein
MSDLIDFGLPVHCIFHKWKVAPNVWIKISLVIDNHGTAMFIPWVKMLQRGYGMLLFGGCMVAG